MGEWHSEPQEVTLKQQLERRLKRAQDEVTRLQAAIQFLEANPGAVDLFTEYQRLISGR